MESLRIETGRDFEAQPLLREDDPDIAGHIALDTKLEEESKPSRGYLDQDSQEGTFPTKTSSGRKRVPTAAALASSEQAQEAAPSKTKTRQKKKLGEGTGVSRTSHGGVKIGGRAVTWVGGAGIAREVLDKMGIPQLRALFLKTFNHPTGSNNAEWLRKKLSQPQDPQVGAARAAVPRARDVGAEIWQTGTTFKGFTKQERVKLQQMGGNCAAKVVEVIRDQPPANPERITASRRRRKKPKNLDSTKMAVIRTEEFELPPPKRARSVDEQGNSQSLLGDCRAPVSQAGSPEPGEPLDSVLSGRGAMSMPVVSPVGTPMLAVQPFRPLHMNEAHLLQTGCQVQVYRADEKWHQGVLEKVDYVGCAPNQKISVTIYYFQHDQSEERPLEEFFRGDQSLLQWQPPTGPLGPVSMQVGGMHAVPMQGMAMAMQGMPVAGGMALGQHMPMYTIPSHVGDVVTAQPVINQVCCTTHIGC